MSITCESRQTCVECGSGQLVFSVQGIEDELKGVCIPGGSDITESSNFIILDEGKTAEIWCVPPSSQSPLVEQAVVYSTLPQEYSTLTFRGGVVADGGGVEERSKVEERSEVMYCIEGDTYIYYRMHNGHSCIA